MEKTLRSVLLSITEKYPELLYDRQKLVSAFGDLAPNMRREKKIVQAFVISNGVDVLCNAKNNQVTTQELDSVIESLVERMYSEEGISSDYAYEVCSAYAMCIGLVYEAGLSCQGQLDNNYEYKELQGGTIGIKKYKGLSLEPIIPDSFNGLRVTRILEGAFKENATIVKVSIPDTITTIGKSAFCNCTALKTVHIPFSVTTIEDNAFYGCSNLADISLSSHLLTIGRLAFYKCKSINDLLLPDCLTTIGNNAFSGCNTLKEIRIPGSIKSLGNSVFAKCSRLNRVILEDGILSIGMYAFSHCSKLKEIILPNTLVTIIKSAFNHCNSLTTVSLPDSIKVIGRYAFWQCYNLQSINLPSTIESIGYGAFSDCGKDITAIVDRGTYAESYCHQSGIRIHFKKDENQQKSVTQLPLFANHSASNEGSHS